MLLTVTSSAILLATVRTGEDAVPSQAFGAALSFFHFPTVVPISSSDYETKFRAEEDATPAARASELAAVAKR